jgi:hypothetical protein
MLEIYHHPLPGGILFGSGLLEVEPPRGMINTARIFSRML